MLIKIQLIWNLTNRTNTVLTKILLYFTHTTPYTLPLIKTKRYFSIIFRSSLLLLIPLLGSFKAQPFYTYISCYGTCFKSILFFFAPLKHKLFLLTSLISHITHTHTLELRTFVFTKACAPGTALPLLLTNAYCVITFIVDWHLNYWLKTAICYITTNERR